jgi:hypothetical protein
MIYFWRLSARFQWLARRGITPQAMEKNASIFRNGPHVFLPGDFMIGKLIN